MQSKGKVEEALLLQKDGMTHNTVANILEAKDTAELKPKVELRRTAIDMSKQVLDSEDR